MATYVALCCTFVSLISLSLGQAPGDIGTFCTSISAIPNYPPTVKRLMDSWSYQTLGGLWTIKDVDNDNQTVRLVNMSKKGRVRERKKESGCL